MYVAPATANSTVLGFVSKDRAMTKMLAAAITTASRALGLSSALQIATGARSRQRMDGAKRARATRCV